MTSLRCLLFAVLILLQIPAYAALGISVFPSRHDIAVGETFTITAVANNYSANAVNNATVGHLEKPPSSRAQAAYFQSAPT